MVIFWCGEPPNLHGDLDFTVARVRLIDDFELGWETKSAGFGLVSFYVKDGKLKCDNERMTREFLKAVFAKLVDDAELTEE